MFQQLLWKSLCTVRMTLTHHWNLNHYLLTTQDYTNMDDQTTIYEMMFKTIYNVTFIDSTQYFGIRSHLNHTFHNHLALEHTTHLQLLFLY